MRRCLQYCHWKAKWWSNQGERLSNVSPSLAEGLVAYASQQMSFELLRAQQWETKWFSIRGRAQLIKMTRLGEEETATTPPELELDLEEEEGEGDEEEDVDSDDDDE